MVDRTGLPYLVIEVGGTTVRAAAFDPESRSLAGLQRRPAPNHLTHGGTDLHGQLLALVRDLGEEVLQGRQPEVVAVAYPGPLSPQGHALAAPTLMGSATSGHAVQASCEALWPGASVVVLNDVTAAGYRYVDAGLRHFCIVTVGSGIGNKVFVQGRPVVGDAGRGGEIGHLQVDPSPDAPICDCGGRGHLGAMASGRGVLAALRRQARRDPTGFRASHVGRSGASPDDVDNVALVAAFRAGDAFVRAVVSTASDHLARVLGSAHLLLGVEAFVLVGGFALALGEDYRRMVASSAASSTWDLGQDWDQMVALGDADDVSGLLGAGIAAAGRPVAALTAGGA